MQRLGGDTRAGAAYALPKSSNPLGTRQAVARSSGWAARKTRWMNRYHARRAGFGRPATGFVSQPEPRTIGSFARGKQLIAGNFLFAGYLVEAPGTSIWDLKSPDPAFDEALHGFTWLDDLAAVGDMAARQLAQAWLIGWMKRFGRGAGLGWTPDITGRRLIRWINHAIFLLNGQDMVASKLYFRSLAQQTLFLSRRWKVAVPGLPRFEALTGMIYAGLALTGMERHVSLATRALSRDCTQQINAEGGIATRNPEELLEVFTLLNWAASALTEGGKMAPREHLLAIERIAPTLRALRHSDGGLARFHGGGRGPEGQLDNALATSGVRAAANTGLAMGFARLSAGRTSVIIDAASPPAGPVSYNAHASTLAFELTSGRRAVVVNCGAGESFGADWRRAGRATPSHSTLALEGFSSARLGAKGLVAGRNQELLADIPDQVRVQKTATQDGSSLQAGHNGYVATHGLTHIRQLDLAFDGRSLMGQDTLSTLSDEDRERFDRVMDRAALQGVPYAIRFHLHPDVEAQVDMGGAAISLALKSGEIWVFRHDGAGDLSLESSVYLERGRLKPRATTQIVLSGRAVEYGTRVRWSLAKAQETPKSIRDLGRDEHVR